jgi:hypothetical protein
MPMCETLISQLRGFMIEGKRPAREDAELLHPLH